MAVWPSRAPRGLDALAAAGVPVYRIEDGFIRSRGLGADFIPPASIILDGRGIYYDPARPSDLEAILAGADFPPALLERAAQLAESLAARGISKYNLSSASARLAAPPGVRRILVPGQVADDSPCWPGAPAPGRTCRCCRRCAPAARTPTSCSNRTRTWKPATAAAPCRTPPRCATPTKWRGAPASSR